MIRRIAITAFFCLLHSGVQAVAEPVRIAYAEVFPPFTELKDGKAEELAVDILRAAAARAGVNVELVPVPLTALGNRLTIAGWGTRARLLLRDPFRKSGPSPNFYDQVLVAEWCKAVFHRPVARPNFCVRVRHC